MRRRTRSPQRSLKQRPEVLDQSLLLPVVVTHPETGREVTLGYDVTTLLEARTSDRELTGILMTDLEGAVEWGVIPVKPYKVRRWVEAGRLIKRITTQGNRGPRVRYTYAEEAEWQGQLSEEDQVWLAALVEADMVLSQERMMRQAVGRLWVGLAEVARAWGEQGQAQEKRRKVKAKERRQQDRARLDDPAFSEERKTHGI